MIIAVVVVVALLFAWYLSVAAARLDRLHHRVETSWEHLDALLQRRASLALEISHMSDLDPATDLLIRQAAYVSREEPIIERNDAERSLSESLKFLRESATSGELTISVPLFDELTSLTEKIKIAIEIHLEAVRSVAKLRSRALYRAFHLAGKAKLPRTYSFEEESL